MGPMDLSCGSLARPRTRQFSDYKVVFFCPIVIEQQAVCHMFDEIHDDEPLRSPEQTITYTFGRIGSYNAAIAGYPGGEVGLGVSGRMVAEVQRDFGKNLEFGLLVGISAGIPSPTRDIRLGDVVVAYPNKASPGVVGHDMVKEEKDGTVLKQWQHATDPTLRSAMNKIQVHEHRPKHNFRRHLEDVARKNPRFRRPTTQTRSAEFLESPTSRLDGNSSEVHYGTILSGNGVIKNKARRNELAAKWDGIAIEMEAAGITPQLGVAVIRGISDFADEAKNDDWHAYAAIAAAAYAKELVLKLGATKMDQHDFNPESVISIDLDVRLSQALPPPSPHFVGRQAELEELRKFVASQPRKMDFARTLAVYGLGGVGKSQLVAEFVGQTRQDNDAYDIFWVTGETKEAFEQSIADILKDNPGSEDAGLQMNYSEQRSIQIGSFFDELKGRRRRQWLLVIDSVPSDRESQDYIMNHVRKLVNGSVILTTRSSSLAGLTTQRLKVTELTEDDAVKLLQEATVDFIPGEEKDLIELVRVFKCHPLSLTLAASNMSRGLETAAHYVDKWKHRQFEYGSPTDNQMLSQCFEVSFTELERQNPSAAMLLMFFGYLDHRDLWIDLCKVAADDNDYPIWLQEIARHPNPLQLCFQLRSLSFVEPKKQGPTADLIWEIHPVIHELARQRAQNMDYEQHFVETAVSVVAANVPRSRDERFLDTARRLALHAEQCKIYLDQNRAGSQPDPDDITGFGNLARLLGRFDEARRHYEYSLRCLDKEQELDQDDLELKASLLNNLGLVCHHQKDYEAAIGFMETSLQTYYQLGQMPNIATMTLLYNIGRSLLMQGKLDLALSHFNEAAAFFRPLNSPGENSANVALDRNLAGHFYYRILNDKGEVHLRKKEYDTAYEIFKLAFKGLSELFHDKHPSTFPIRLNIGRICCGKYQFKDAKRVFHFVLDTYISWWGRRHSETMRAIEELAGAEAMHGLMKRKLEDGGGNELSAGISLMREVVAFHSEVFGENSASAQCAKEKLRIYMDWEKNGVSENEYAMYNNSADMRPATV